MKSEKFSHALGEIDVSYIEEAIHYKAVHRRKQKIWKIAVACVAVAMVAILIMPLWDTNKKESESTAFVLVAYASENNKVMKSEVQVGKSVPISFFETENGWKGFLFAYHKSNPKEVSSISVMTEGEFPNVIEKIIGLELETDKHYTFYIPEQEKEFPYSFMIPYTDEIENKVILCYLLVEETEDGYSAVIERMEEFEQRMRK